MPKQCLMNARVGDVIHIAHSTYLVTGECVLKHHPSSTAHPSIDVGYIPLRRTDYPHDYDTYLLIRNHDYINKIIKTSK